jgi:hypothetical protein
MNNIDLIKYCYNCNSDVKVNPDTNIDYLTDYKISITVNMNCSNCGEHLDVITLHKEF